MNPNDININYVTRWIGAAAVRAAQTSSRSINQTVREGTRVTQDSTMAARANVQATRDMGTEARSTSNVIKDSTTAVSRNRTELDKHNKSVSRSVGELRKLNIGFTSFRNLISLLKWPAIITGAGLAAEALGALSGAAAALTGALAPLSGALVAYPALLGAIGQAMVTLKVAGMGPLRLAVGGLNQQLDKTTTAWKKLSPAAQDFAVKLQAMKAPLRDIQNAVQARLFQGFGQAIDQMRGHLGPFRAVLVQTADTIGQLAKRAADLASSKGFGQDIRKIGAENAQILDRMGRAGLQLFSALRHVLVAARPLLDWMTKQLVIGAKFINQQAAAARESGKLARFFRETRDVATTLGHIFRDVGVALWNIVSAGKPLGDTILKSLESSAASFREWTESARGKNTIADYFKQIKPAIFEMGRLIRDVTKAFFTLSTGPGLAPLIKQIRTELLPVLTTLIGSTTQAFGPHLIRALTSVARLIGTLAGSSGPLTLTVDAIGRMADFLNLLFKNVPGLRAATVDLLAIAAISKTLKFTGAITGVNILIGLFKDLRLAALGAASAEQLAGKGPLLTGLARRGGVRGILGRTAATTVETEVAQAPFGAPLPAAASRGGMLSRVGTRVAPFAARAGLVAGGGALLAASQTGALPGGAVGGALGAAAGGAMAGAAFGPWGAAAGAAIGLIINFRKQIIGVLSDVIGWLKSHWKIVAVVLAGPFAPFVALVVTHLHQIRDAFVWVFGAIKAVAGPAFTVLRTLFFVGMAPLTIPAKLLMKVLPGIFRATFGAVRAAVRWGVGVIKKVWDAIKDVFGPVIRVALRVAGAILRGYFNTWRALIRGGIAVIRVVWSVIRDVIVNPIRSAVRFVINTFGSIWDKIKGPIHSVTGGIKDAFSGIKGVVTDVFDHVKSVISGAVDTIRKIVGFVLKVLDFIPGVDLSAARDAVAGSSGGIPGSFFHQRGRTTNRVSGRGMGQRGGIVDRPQFLVGEQAPQHPEYVIATNPAYRSRNVGLLRSAATKLGVRAGAIGVGPVSISPQIPTPLHPLPFDLSLPGPQDLLKKGGAAAAAFLLKRLIGGVSGIAGGLPPWMMGASDFAVDKGSAFIQDHFQTGGVIGGGGPTIPDVVAPTGSAQHPLAPLKAMPKQADDLARATIKNLQGPLKKGYGDSAKDAKGFTDGVTKEFTEMRKVTTDATGKLRKNATDQFTRLKRDGSDAADQLHRNVQRDVDGMHDQTNTRLRDMADTTRKQFGNMTDSAQKQGQALKQSVRGSMGQADSAVYTGMHYITQATMQALKSFDAKPIHLSVSKPKLHAQGGILAGMGTADTVPLIHGFAAPGEAILTGHQQRLANQAFSVAQSVGAMPFGSVEELIGFERRPHGFDKGGLVPNTPNFARGGKTAWRGIGPQGLKPGIKQATALLLGQFPGLSVTSTTGGGHVAGSYHYLGEATDTSGSTQEMFSAAEWIKRSGLFRSLTEGIHNPNLSIAAGQKVPSSVYAAVWAAHANHIHMAVTKALGALRNVAPARQLGPVRVGGTAGPTRAIVQGSLNQGRAAANRYIGRHSGTGLDVPTGPVQQMARRMVSMMWGAGQWGPFNALEMSEAGWNPRALNASSGAAGLAQALPASKYPPGAWPYRGLQSAKLQLQWMMQYIKGRYGTPARAWAFHQANNWYKQGGFVGTPPSARVPKLQLGGLLRPPSHRATGPAHRLTHPGASHLGGSGFDFFTRLLQMSNQELRKLLNQVTGENRRRQIHEEQAFRRHLRTFTQGLNDLSIGALDRQRGRINDHIRSLRRGDTSRRERIAIDHLKSALDSINDELSRRARNISQALAGEDVRLSLATTRLQAMELRQELRGQQDSGGPARARFIRQHILPTLRSQQDRLERQLRLAVARHQLGAARDIREALAQKQVDILQAQLDAQNAIKENTDKTAATLEQMSGTIGFEFGGQAFTDVIGMGTGV